MTRRDSIVCQQFTRPLQAATQLKRAQLGFSKSIVTSQHRLSRQKAISRRVNAKRAVLGAGTVPRARPNYEVVGPSYRVCFDSEPFVPSGFDRITVKTELSRTELSRGDCTATEMWLAQMQYKSACGHAQNFPEPHGHAGVCTSDFVVDRAKNDHVCDILTFY
jgi:hypothetical protein